MSRESVAIRGRQFSEQGMTSTCVITRVAGETLNQSTGKYEPTTIKIYPTDPRATSGPCELAFRDVDPLEVEAQAQPITKQQLVLSLPVGGSTAVQVDDVAEIRTNPLDAEPVMTKVRITGRHFQTYSVSRRFPVEVLS
jgi:hypothetical protein